MNKKRRSLLFAMAGLTVSSSSVVAKSLMSTPRQSAGPFYPLELPLDDDNDLTSIKGQSGKAKGKITDLTGRIVDINGRPLSGLRIEIWQCDANGRYRHPYENGNKPIDRYFQGHGNTITDTNGDYLFRTIQPVAYPGRTPHIHVAVFPNGEKPFVTQLYVKNEPRNFNDFLFKRVPLERRHLVVSDFITSSEPGIDMQASFNIVLNRRDGTPTS